jgi:hypothetical protein
MFLKIINTFTHMPMLWDVIIPLIIIAIFCVVLFWEGIYGHATGIVQKIRGAKRMDKGS